MRAIYYAKSNPPQTLEEHTEKALEEYKLLKKLFPDILTEKEWEMLRVAVECHDLGKLDVNFQNKIREKLKEAPLEYGDDFPEIPHNYLSGALIDNAWLDSVFTENEKSAVLRAVYFHHDRKPTELSHKEQRLYIEDNLLEGVRGYTSESVKISTVASTRYLKYDFTPTEDEPEYIKVKGLLNRIDYCASAGVPIETPYDTSVGDKTESFVVGKYKALRSLQQYMKSNSEENVVVTAATGSGKTEAALLWLDGAKGFYTLPLKISINAIFERITDKKAIGFEECGILHSDALSYYLDTDENPLYKYACSKNFSSPLTICTVDQLLKFAYKYNGSEMQLATLAYSKLIIDEIQTYSPELLGTILYALGTVTELGGKFAVITATFPPLLKDFLPQTDIKYSPNFYGNVSHRHKAAFVDGDEFDIEKIVDDGKGKKVLVIVNTVSRAQMLYEILSESTDVHLLHSMFLKKDRAALETKIMTFAGNGTCTGESGIWISTQIVEASLDIDFDVLYTEMCTIDSLFQRMGRVFRSRDYFGSEPNVYVLNNRNGVGKLIDDEIYEWSVEALERCLDGKPSATLFESEGNDLKQAMIEYVYGENRKSSSYYKKIKEQITRLKNIEWYKVEKSDTDKIFRNIDSKTIIPISIYNDLAEQGKTEAWRKDICGKHCSPVQKQRIKDEIAGYTVSISFYHNLDIGYEEVFYPHSGIYVYNGDYDFDGELFKGGGIIKNYGGKYETNALII